MDTILYILISSLWRNRGYLRSTLLYHITANKFIHLKTTQFSLDLITPIGSTKYYLVTKRGHHHSQSGNIIGSVFRTKISTLITVQYNKSKFGRKYGTPFGGEWVELSLIIYRPGTVTAIYLWMWIAMKNVSQIWSFNCWRWMNQQQMNCNDTCDLSKKWHVTQ